MIPADTTLLFVVGCPRSGTTWLQFLLAQHDAVHTAQETHLFSNYIAPLHRMWEAERESGSPVGLRVVLDDEAFLAHLRALAADALGRIVEGPLRGGDVIVEKTPLHVEVAPLILALFPDARFLHVVRDPRAVTASLIAASAGWARGWAPGGAVAAGRFWNRTVGAGRAIAGLTTGYREVRYEDVMERPATELAGLFDWLGLAHDAAMCERIVEACSAERMVKAPDAVRAPSSMRDFVRSSVRKGSADGWRAELTDSQVATVEYVTRHFMRTYGYTPVVNRAARPTLRARTAGRLEVVRDRLASFLERVIRPL